MRENRIKNWEDNPDLDCLLFFALRARELAFDFTLDTYKTPALNSFSICNEALFIISLIQRNDITDKAIIPILEELIWKLRSDYMVRKILNQDLNSYLNFGDNGNLSEIKTKLEILSNKLSLLKFADSIEKELINLIKENKEKNLIDELATNYIATLLNIGFSQSFIHSAINSFFFHNKKVKSVDVLEDFFLIFDSDYQEYTVVMKCDNLFNEIQKSSETFKCEIKKELEETITKYDKDKFLASIGSGQSFFIAKKIHALDSQSAKNIAHIRINKLSKLFVFYHHKQHPNWSEKALIINDTKEDSILLKEKVSPMSKGKDLKPEKAAIKLNKLIKGIKLEENSFSKYDKAIDLHGLSVESKNVENQLLQNWIALETLLVGYSQKSKIDQVIDNITPFLKYKYIENLIDELLRNVLLFDYKLVREELKKVPYGSTPLEKFIALLAMEEFKESRQNFYKALRRSPLLKNRLAKYNSLLSSSKKMKELLENHEQKVIWQLRRIYRTRNLIVHVGIVPEYTETLVENAHSYLDNVINTINELSIDHGSITSIDQAIMETRIQVTKQKNKILSNLDLPIDKDNFISIILNK